MDIVKEKSSELKSNEDLAQIIAWRYNLKLGGVTEWLESTSWSTQNFNSTIFNDVVNSLLRLGLLESHQMENWQQKLFFNNTQSIK